MRGLSSIKVLIGWFLLVGMAAAQSTDSSSDGNLLLARVLESLERHATVSAKLRYQARLGEHTLVGSGVYQQLGGERKPLSRWEMQTQIGEATASFVQTFDGTHLWTDRRLPSGRRVHRLDVPRLHAQLRTAGWGVPRESRLAQMLLAAQGRGGLTQMLADLLNQYDFSPPRTTQWNGLAVDALVGRWRFDALREVWPDVEQLDSNDPPRWPAQIPHHVLILVGKNLFPYVIEHRRVDDAVLLGSVSGLRQARDPLLRYELFEVQFAAVLDRAQFAFHDDVDWKDETSLIVNRLGRPRLAETASRSESKDATR